MWILPSHTLFGDDLNCICFDHPNRETAMLSTLFLLPVINHVVCMYQDAAGEVYENLKFNVQQQQSQDYTLIL